MSPGDKHPQWFAVGSRHTVKITAWCVTPRFVLILCFCCIDAVLLSVIQLLTGQKGIGFKSVFKVTDCPEIHSNGFHLRFDKTCGPMGYILPHWVEDERPLDTHLNDMVQHRSDKSTVTDYFKCTHHFKHAHLHLFYWVNFNSIWKTYKFEKHTSISQKSQLTHLHRGERMCLFYS